MTKLIRVQEETYNQLQKLSGKLQARHGTRFSLDKTIQALLEDKVARRSPAGAEKSQNKAEADEFADSLKWFSMHHKAFKDEKNPISSTKAEQK
ncbi:hypothetical protein HYV43_05310 [Candidatus Micrarchaeota archaeon]|nr:hypothetical protein [Candidatus Micrarchaeota archaeon]